MGRGFLNLNIVFLYIFLYFTILIFQSTINHSLSVFLQNEAIKRNSLVIKVANLENVLLYCEAFSINTSYFKLEECEQIKSKISKLENELNQNFLVLDFYIKYRGTLLETKKNI